MTNPPIPPALTWLSVPGYEGCYEASDSGLLRRVAGYDSMGRPRRERALKPSINPYGYYQVSLSKGGVHRSARVHSLVALAFLGPRPDGQQINHIDGCKTNNAPANLEYATPRQNTLHAIRLGLRAGGERHGQARLYKETVVKIRRLCSEGMDAVPIAKLYGIHPSHVIKIKNGKAWAALLPPPPE